MTQTILITAIISMLFGHWATDKMWEYKWTKAELQAQENQRAAVNEAVLQYKNRVTSLELISRETEKELNIAERSANNAAANAHGLQLKLTDYLRNGNRCTASTPTTTERAAEATQQLVLTELFGRMERRVTGLAKIADESRIRGLACQAAYNDVWKNLN